MNKLPPVGLHKHLSHNGNLKNTRYGWLRLTPAYSVHVVSEILENNKERPITVLDPFCGTGTTSLVCAERGIRSVTTDINPFLIWLTRVKTNAYSQNDLLAFENGAECVATSILDEKAAAGWTPPLHQIEKWWDTDTLAALSRIMGSIRNLEKLLPTPSLDLLKIAFCRVLIERSNASFGHQSMSFKKQQDDLGFSYPAVNDVDCAWKRAISAIAESARTSITQTPHAVLCDARSLSENLEPNCISCVITSPPYPNRMSYIRELRPYMYWLGYLENGRDAADMDWQAIGGTWGTATSNVGRWTLGETREIPYAAFPEILKRIGEQSPLLSRYVHKYFYDMVRHSQELCGVVKPGGSIHYIIGNSKFYDVMLPAQEIFASLFRSVGFTDVKIDTLRKRTSKKELFEYVVSAFKVK